MDIEKVGKSIAYLRKQAGYTQKDLAARIGISDKAVSKWERGLSLPDVSYLGRLSIILNTDTDSLLSGTAARHDHYWCGIIVLNESSCGIGASTIVYDKPLVYFLLSYFLLVGIKTIHVICSEVDMRFLSDTLKDGKEYGISLTYHIGTFTEVVQQLKIAQGNIMLTYGRFLLYGVDQTRFFQKAMVDLNHVTVLALPKKSNQISSRILMDANKRIINSNTKELLRTQYDYCSLPILFFPHDVLNEMASEGDISAYLRKCQTKNGMYVELLDRGFVDIEIDDWNHVQEASLFLRIVQEKCGMNVYCIEEVAWRRGLISLEQLYALGRAQSNAAYGDYIISLYNRIKSRGCDIS